MPSKMIRMLHHSGCRMVKAATASQAAKRKIHASVSRRVKDDVYVTTTSAAYNNDTQTKTVGGSSCSKPELNNNAVGQDDEEEHEEMFVTAHPTLGVGSIREWGGPTRGGRLAEPTRFGDWERKGRCTDF